MEETALARILVVDDDEAVRIMLTKILAMDSHDITTSENGIHALNCLRMQLPDVVILDIIMPDKEGFETIIEMRRDYPDLKNMQELLAAIRQLVPAEVQS